MNKIRLMSLEIVVAPLEAPQRLYGMSVLDIYNDGIVCEQSDCRRLDAEYVYARLRRGVGVKFTRFDITPYARESQSVLLAESALLLSEVAPSLWRLTMP